MVSDEENSKRLVVKFGGSSLATNQRISRAVSTVANEARRGSQIVVVVSAMGKTTDHLLQVVNKASNEKVDDEELDEILAMGERTCIRIFAAALKAAGLESRYFDPLDPDWPIITDDVFSDATPILPECEERTRRYLLPLLKEGVIPVVAGFVGRTQDEKVTTLGRGGSDTTAFILSKALNADSLILVTDAKGIMSADPKIVDNPEIIPEIGVGTLMGLADSGEKFFHIKALRYRDPSVKVKIISHIHGDLNAEGTSIRGDLSPELDVTLTNEIPAMSVTIVGRSISERPEVIQALVEAVKVHTRILGLSLNYDSVIFYIPEEDDSTLPLQKVHELILEYEETCAMSVRKQLALLKIKGIGLEETPGIIGDITEKLKLCNINIFGLLTIASSIMVFVQWNERERALNLIERALQCRGE